MEKDIIHMSKKELERLPILHRIRDKRLTQIKGAEIMGITNRQIRRLVTKITIYGDEAIIHKNRCKPSPKKISREREMKIVDIIKQNYSDFPPLHASQKLAEKHHISLSKEKVRQLMISANLWRAKSKKNNKVHQWRKRKDYRGELVQMDGSHHDWLEGRGPRLVLMGIIDDATGEFFGRFYLIEGTYPAMDCFRRYIVKYGLPRSVYLDRHSTYKATRNQTLEEQFKGSMPRTQFGRALHELNVNIIYAYSPQAKGRIERVFKTLQERLVKELRLAGAGSLSEANKFLGKYLKSHNQSFAKLPMKSANLHTPVGDDVNLREIFCIKESRKIGNDYTVSYNNRLFLIKKPSFTMRRQWISVLEQHDGSISFLYQGKQIATKEVSHYSEKYLVALKKTLRKIKNVPLRVIKSWEEILLEVSS